MTNVGRVAVTGLLGLTVSGCIAAALPVVASSVIVRKQMQAKRESNAARPAVAAAAPVAVNPPGPNPATAELASAGKTPPAALVPVVVPVAHTPGVTPALQYLYGSGEAAAASVQAYNALAAYLDTFRFRQPASLRQVVLTDGSTLEKPYFEPCGAKPLAVVLDVDETALLNLGYEANDAQNGLPYDDARWQRWEATGANQVVAVPGVKAALDTARKDRIAVIFNSNRSAAFAKQTEDAINGAGLGPVVHGETLWLKGDDGGGSAKDGRRWAIATGYCVVALVGDQLGDFSDLLNDPALTPAARRTATQQGELSGLWGKGWFVLPNPVYGTALKGGIDDVFPADKRWTDSAEGAK